MEHGMDLAAGKSRKRKAAEEADWVSAFSLDELNQDLLERVLSYLPASSFFRLRPVCKRWKSITNSATFQIACAQIPIREPWFLMVDQDLDQSTVLDTSEWNWKNLSLPIQFRDSHNMKPIPVAASGGLVCFRTVFGGLKVCNPVTGACRELPQVVSVRETSPLHAIALHSSPGSSSSYRIVLVSGDISNLAFRVFDSIKGTWEDEVNLVHTTKSSLESHSGSEIFYFLSKTGDVVASNMQRSPSKQYSSVLTVENEEEVVYFISHSGNIVACNLVRKTFSEYPRLLPVYFEYSIDVVECNGEMLVVILSEFLETASVRIWKFSREVGSWQQVAAMPPSMSHEFYGKKLDINCTGWRNMILICINNYNHFSSCVMFHMEANEWMVLPKCCVDGSAKEFMSAFSFEPRLEVAV
ncbi:F-box only protein 13 [Canna indica]|uniref:F-box only protein 13 n=1 Tax=Canna indica TaxID=4628 RepID=A0AAQ3QJE3_9LILI|nr:F-box only protein 13 [Canna indica]